MEKRKKAEEDEEQKQPPAAESPWGGDLLPEILREILSRVPYRSLCRFRCVSTAWLALCSDPAVRRRSPQTLSGFFCYSQHDVGGGQRRDALGFLNLSGWGRPLVDDPSLRFVRVRGYCDVTPLHCCGGILLCYCEKAAMSDDGNYVVCNPATKEVWAVLPVPRNKIMTRLNTARLCFDPAAPGRFVVFVFVQSFRGIQTVEAYASDTGRWTSMRSEWSPKTLLLGEDSECVFLNGTLHLVDADHSDADFDWEGNLIRWMVTVDMEGKTWRKIRLPDSIYNGFIGQSQGRLYATHVETEGRCRLSVWVLEDYASGQWTLKCTASILEMLGRPHHEPGEHYTLIAIHPECSLIFLVGAASREKTLMSYDMDTSKLSIICTLGDRQPRRFQPYVPCFAEKPR
ncbi:F-box protein At5g07610-like [Triticum dicoccoides]|uniref:F-box protein At5g07610-like n=1 Tax=Triticum dicoccoides TaxID=85692 RepID=UPI00188E151B|nr:F-box protein At5g07610-like [Triticum dicoccoides]XP_037473767.1 F-box protein At5g07610-like [Triticum dicoccoides]